VVQKKALATSLGSNQEKRVLLVRPQPGVRVMKHLIFSSGQNKLGSLFLTNFFRLVGHISA
jgi:hypothetical protein